MQGRSSPSSQLLARRSGRRAAERSTSIVQLAPLFAGKGTADVDFGLRSSARALDLVSRPRATCRTDCVHESGAARHWNSPRARRAAASGSSLLVKAGGVAPWYSRDMAQAGAIAVGIAPLVAAGLCWSGRWRAWARIAVLPAITLAPGLGLCLVLTGIGGIAPAGSAAPSTRWRW